MNFHKNMMLYKKFQNKNHYHLNYYLNNIYKMLNQQRYNKNLNKKLKKNKLIINTTFNLNNHNKNKNNLLS